MRGAASGAAFLAGVASLALVLLAAPGPSPAFVSGPPLGQTGGFGEPTCHSCHNELALDSPEAGRLSVEGLPGTYEPGVTYLLNVLLSSQDMSRAGFELSVRFEGTSPPGRQAGALATVDDRVAIGHLGLTPVYYAFHTRAGSDVQSGESAVWTVEWTAPESADPVVVHVVANSANGDDSPLGDFILTRADTLRAEGS